MDMLRTIKHLAKCIFRAYSLPKTNIQFRCLQFAYFFARSLLAGVLGACTLEVRKHYHAYTTS